MSEPPVWVRFTDGKVERKGLVRGWAPRGRGKNAHIAAVVQAKDKFYEVPIADILAVRAPHRKKG